MSVQSHLQELQRRHAALESEIHREMTSPASDPLKVAEMKRRKLVLKDQINRLSGDVTLH
ncbi:YdcH family protein [Xanthobacteraceae bacterium A53D]